MQDNFWKSEENFRAIFRDLRVGMLLLSLDDRILAANPEACNFLGYSEAELLTRTFAPSLMPRTCQPQSNVRIGAIWSFKFPRRSKCGTSEKTEPCDGVKSLYR